MGRALVLTCASRVRARGLDRLLILKTCTSSALAKPLDRREPVETNPAEAADTARPDPAGRVALSDGSRARSSSSATPKGEAAAAGGVRTSALCAPLLARAGVSALAL